MAGIRRVDPERAVTLGELVRKARERYEALSPVDRAIADIRQRQSWVRGELKLGTEFGNGISDEQIAKLPKDPAVVLADEVERLRRLIRAAGLEA